MKNPFDKVLTKLKSQTRLLVEMEPISIDGKMPIHMPKEGIYLFSEGKVHLYVGKSDNIRKRLQLHSRPGSQQNQATFAFRIARKELRVEKAAYTTKGSRNNLVKQPGFAAAFQKAKNRVRKMKVRYVAEHDPIMQVLLEVYAAVSLGTKYNEFKNT